MWFIWMRHGETAHNRARRYVGHLDVALTRSGRDQALEAGRRLAGVAISTIYTSDLKRCQQTARLVMGQLHAEVCYGPVATDSLRELDFGQWDGATYEQIMQQDGARATLWYDNPLDHAPPAGEALRDLGERVDRWLFGTIAAHNPEDIVLVVTHGGPIRWFQYRWLLGRKELFWSCKATSPGGFIVAQWDGRCFTEEEQPQWLTLDERN